MKIIIKSYYYKIDTSCLDNPHKKNTILIMFIWKFLFAKLHFTKVWMEDGAAFAND